MLACASVDESVELERLGYCIVALGWRLDTFFQGAGRGVLRMGEAAHSAIHSLEIPMS